MSYNEQFYKRDNKKISGYSKWISPLESFIPPILFISIYRTYHMATSPRFIHLLKLLESQCTQSPSFCFNECPAYTGAKAPIPMTYSLGWDFKGFGCLNEHPSKPCNIPEGSHSRLFSLHASKENILAPGFRWVLGQSLLLPQATWWHCWFQFASCSRGGVCQQPTLTHTCGSCPMRNFIKPWQP